MRNLLILFLIFPVLFSCNDGDVLVENFNFDGANLQTCGDVGSYVFFKENTESFESLSLHLGTSDSIYNEPAIKTYTLNNTSTFVNYRRHDGPLGNNYFCNNVPPSSPTVIEEYKAVSGSAQVIVTFEYESDNHLGRTRNGFVFFNNRRTARWNVVAKIVVSERAVMSSVIYKCRCVVKGVGLNCWFVVNAVRSS